MIFRISRRKQDFIQPITSKHSDGRYEEIDKWLFYEWFFPLGDEGEIDTNRFFENSSELANFIDKILDKNIFHYIIQAIFMGISEVLAK